MKRRIFAILLTAALLLALFPGAAFADGTEITADASAAVYMPGDTVEVMFSISGNPGFWGAGFTVEYDSDALELTGFEKGTLFESGSMTYNTANGAIAFYGGSITDNIGGDGAMFSALFTVRDNAEFGSYQVTAKLKDDKANNFINAGRTALPVSFTGCKVNIGSSAADDWINPYKDVKESDWFYDAVKFVSVNGIMIGTELDMFSPQLTLTRAQIVQMLYNYEGKPNSGEVFSDVQGGIWYYDAVNWASSNDIVSGYGDGRFGPDDAVTREQFVTILYRFADWKGYAAGDFTSLNQYTDSGEISSYAYEAFMWAVSHGIISGMTESELSPKSGGTRAQAAVIMKRFAETKFVGANNPTSTSTPAPSATPSPSSTPKPGDNPGTVTVDLQRGTLTAGSSGSVSYAVTTKNIDDGTYTAKLSGAPSGVSANSLAIRGNSGTLTLTVSGGVSPGTYFLTVTVDGAESPSFALTISVDESAVSSSSSDPGSSQSPGSVSSGIKVHFSLLGTVDHDDSFVGGERIEGTPLHTLANGGLTTWMNKTVTVAESSNIKDVLDAAGVNYSMPYPNYVNAVTFGGITIGEFTNGSNSGWMYTLNGVHPNLGVEEQLVRDGDTVVFHYTDDYTQEEGSRQMR